MTGVEHKESGQRDIAGRPVNAEPALFSGPWSVRVPRERWALTVCLLSAPITIALVGLLFKAVTYSDMVLLIVAGMAYVSISRGRSLGSSIHVHGRQFPELHALVASVAERLGVPAPEIFVRDEFFVPITAVGLGEPYSLLISSQYLEHLKPGELRFLVARELAHIAAGHTRLSSLLSASGRENFAIGLIFGSWLRRTEYTADRAGLICCESLADAIGAVAITTFHSIGRRVDLEVLNEQGHDLQTDPALRFGEWIGGMPYATNRIASLRAFAQTDSMAFWRSQLALPRPPVVAIQGVEPGTTVQRRDLAPPWRRAFVFAIDISLVYIISNTAVGTFSEDAAKRHAITEMPGWLAAIAHTFSHVTLSGSTAGLLFPLYSILLVALSGQTLGMMIGDVRVVTTQSTPAGIGRIVWRYLLAGLALTTVVIAALSSILRVQFHDRFSGTRVVRGRALPTGGAGRPPRRVEETE
jgi:Zn-dependent protease with chaperone function/uncharacterized RDD family membrane protein YckC